MESPSQEPQSLLSPTQRYAAGALFALAVHQANLHQTRPLGLFPDNVDDDNEMINGRSSNSSSTGSISSGADSVSEDPELWVHLNNALLRPIFRVLDIDSVAWSGLEETAGSSSAHHHVGAFLRLLSEDSDNASQSSDHEVALAKAIDAVEHSMEATPAFSKKKKEILREYEHECREKCSTESKRNSEIADVNIEKHENDGGGFSNLAASEDVTVSSVHTEKPQERVSPMVGASDIGSIDGTDVNLDKPLENSNIFSDNDQVCESSHKFDKRPPEEVMMLSKERKVTVLYELLSACLADAHESDRKHSQRRKGYDARHRVALHLLATWLDIKWLTLEAVETMVACSAMALKKEDEKREEADSSESRWAKWKRGGIIGAAALTGGTLIAITGGLAAPAIAAGFGALAPTLGTLVPLIGAGGFAAAASAAGTVAGSVAIAASFGAAGAGLTGSKMARRIGSVDEFEFKAVGENHNQGRLAVEILISGFVFDKEDFIKPWEGQIDNLERYILQWESKNLIAVSTAIQDWLTSGIAMELMKQGAMMTVLSTLVAALAWPATLLSATSFIDSKWSIAVDRSDKAGKLLAEALLKGLQGNRPVTLIGYSLGARMIFKCLQCLAEAEHNAGLVERVVLLGAPIAIKDENWEAARKVVAGRFINAYSTNDWILGVAFRASLLTRGLAGIQPINVPGIQNVDVTELIEGHSSYLWATQKILERLELDTYYPVFKSNP